MQQELSFVAIIPARFGSTRFPGKPLALIQGKPMFWHVYSRACLCPDLQSVYLATDDQRILQEAEKLNVPALLTSSEHASGTDRVLEAAQALGLGQNTVVLNIQGDEPALEPEMLSQLLLPFQKDQVQVSTLARSISANQALDPNQVKVVCNHQGQALYFSRAAIPYNAGNEEHYLGHIGLYAYQMQTLHEFSRLGPSILERTEKLEQLRLLQAGIPVRVVITKHLSYGVDRPQDIQYIEKILLQEQQQCRQF